MTQGAGPVWIEADQIRFRTGPGGMLTSEWNGRQDQVAASRLFPATFPDGWIAVRDSSGQEWGVLRSTDGLDAISREALERETRFRPFLPRIVRIFKIRRLFNQWHWDVLTEAGPMKFRTGPLYEATVRLQGGCRLVTDISDQIYALPEETERDAGSRKALGKWL